jgi:membrane-associated protease RseP (regulator of RpoE activity)
VIAAGPLTVLLAGEATLAAALAVDPHAAAVLALNRPSDVLRGLVAPTAAEQLLLTVGVGLVSFALLALLPVPPLDGHRLARAALGAGGRPTALADRLGAVALLLAALVPIAGTPPLLTTLDVIGAPLVRPWAAEAGERV